MFDVSSATESEKMSSSSSSIFAIFGAVPVVSGGAMRFRVGAAFARVNSGTYS